LLARSSNKKTYVDPVESHLLPRDDLVLLEPEVNLLLGILDRVGAVADVATDILHFLVLACFSFISCTPSLSLVLLGVSVLTMAKSPRMVPGAEASGFVAPRRTRPVLTASRPSQTMAQMGPEPM